jgi:orotidine-5'-phosphate decarboxylase
MTPQTLASAILAKQTYLCVGLDPDLGKIPPCLKGHDNPLYAFNREIIDATAPHAIAFKPNFAFYESLGSRGLNALEQTAGYIRANYPGILLIADAKRADIGNTAQQYARAVFKTMPFHAVTLSPYMGYDSIAPFLEYDDKFAILLALTSNPGAANFQMIKTPSGRLLFEEIICQSQQWPGSERIMYVAGATKAPMLADIRRLAPGSFLLVPGVGAQGGSLAEVSEYGMTPQCGIIVNASRSIIYASSGSDFQQAAAAAAQEIHNEMATCLKRRKLV